MLLLSLAGINERKSLQQRPRPEAQRIVCSQADTAANIAARISQVRTAGPNRRSRTKRTRSRRSRRQTRQHREQPSRVHVQARLRAGVVGAMPVLQWRTASCPVPAGSTISPRRCVGAGSLRATPAERHSMLGAWPRNRRCPTGILSGAGSPPALDETLVWPRQALVFIEPDVVILGVVARPADKTPLAVCVRGRALQDPPP